MDIDEFKIELETRLLIEKKLCNSGTCFDR